MKTTITILLLIITFNSFSQKSGWYLGTSLGITFSNQYNQVKGKETFTPQSFLWSMPISYQLNNFIFEAEPTYAGILSIPVTIGWDFCLNENIYLQLHGGVSDVIYPDLTDGIQVTQKFYPMAKVRLQIFDGFVEGSYYGQTYFFSLGLRCKMFKTD